MAKKRAKAVVPEEGVFVPISALPEELQKRHRKRRIAMDVLHKKLGKIHEQGEDDLKRTLAKGALKNGKEA